MLETICNIKFLQDPTNLNGKVQKHQNFEQELNANKLRLEETHSTGQELIESHHYASRNIIGLLFIIEFDLKRCVHSNC